MQCKLGVILGSREQQIDKLTFLNYKYKLIFFENDQISNKTNDLGMFLMNWNFEAFVRTHNQNKHHRSQFKSFWIETFLCQLLKISEHC